MQTYGDDALARAVARAEDDDPGALHFLFTRYAGEVRPQVESVLGDPREAETVTQELFAKLPAALRRSEHTELPFSTWLRLVARRAALDHLRRPGPNE